MNGLARTLANTSTQIAKIDHHHSRHLTHSQEPVQNTFLPDKNHRLDYWSQLGEYQHLLLWNSLFLHWETTSDHRLEHLTGFLERTLLLQTAGRRRGPTAPRSQDLDGFFEPCARTGDQLWQTTFAGDLAVWRPHGLPTRSPVTTLLLWVHTVEDDLQEIVSFSQSAAVWLCQQVQFDSKCFPLSNRLSIVLFTDGGSVTFERSTFGGLGRRTISKNMMNLSSFRCFVVFPCRVAH